MAWSSPRTWVAGEVLSAALLNQELRDNLLAAEPTGSLHYYIRAATTVETLINGFALETNGVTPLRATYASLNTLLSSLGYPFGSGNGSTTFTLPDVQGRSLVSHASGGHADSNALGDSDQADKIARAQKELIGGTIDSSGLTVSGQGSTTIPAGTGGGNVQAGTALDVGGTATYSGWVLTGAYLVAGVWAVKT